jgi:hypothetical protein
MAGRKQYEVRLSEAEEKGLKAWKPSSTGSETGRSVVGTGGRVNLSSPT